MNIEDEWPDIPFSSAEIEEMQFRFAKALKAADPTEMITLDLSFPKDRAQAFIDTVNKAPYYPMAAAEVLRFCQYLAGVVHYKLHGDD